MQRPTSRTLPRNARKPVKGRKAHRKKPGSPNKRQLTARSIAWFWHAPGFVQALIGVLLLSALIPSANWIYQVIRKPSELFFPISAVLYKTPTETWRRYSSIFIKHSTAVMTPTLLAALAQAEASGNPVARTYWRWSFSTTPTKIYQPASSAVGMYQIIDGTFDEARRYCIHDHRVVEDGPWHQPRSCWFNALYMRVIPSHAVELTAANLDRQVAATLARHRIYRASLPQKQALAIVTHLCGAGAGSSFAARGLRVYPGQRCGDHDLQAYIARVQRLEQGFADLRTKH